MKTAVIAVVLAVAAGAQVTGWKRADVAYTSFTAEFPAGPGVAESRGTFKSGEKYHFIHIANKGEKTVHEDRLALSYTKNSLITLSEGAWGEPELVPLRTFKRWSYTVKEAGWRFEHGGRMKNQFVYEVEVAPSRYLEIDLNCFEPACKKYISVYFHLRDSMMPPRPKKKP